MMKYHQTKFGCQRIRSWEDIVRTVTVCSIEPPDSKTSLFFVLCFFVQDATAHDIAVF